MNKINNLNNKIQENIYLKHNVNVTKELSKNIYYLLYGNVYVKINNICFSKIWENLFLNMVKQLKR